jgi:hypothetical protein
VAVTLDEAHRLAQLRVGADTVRRMLILWPLLDVNNLDGSFENWLTAVVPLMRSQRSISARLAATYYEAVRLNAVGFDRRGMNLVLAEELPLEQAATSMLVTGPASLRSNLSRGMTIAKALNIAAARSAAAGMRHALNGGRETITASAKADSRRAGWERLTSGNACDFCELLADRGAVYSEDAADFEAHDHCSCSAVPVFD